ncbi:hypothetical protein [Amycolatopsis sp. GM8]|uniref:hypothetical protein n=1 Tax=Amycolatopsis sp. GM8 TaxID=2896530 RepID=UPI001F360C79|nr:hypothetical protein [Amycolatopsis sp. GM8]
MLSQSGSTTRPTRRIITLADELADELSRFDADELGTAELRGLMRGMTGTASALTRILDQLRECPVLTQSELDRPAHQTMRSELDQAAAAAEDLRVTAESLCRLLPVDMSGPLSSRRSR